MTAEANKALVRAFVEAVNARDWSALETLVTEDFVRTSDAAGSPAVASREDLVRFLRSELEAFPDGRESIEDLVAEGDRVAARHVFRGTQLGPLGPHRATGREMRGTQIAIYRIANGRIAEVWTEWDNLAGLRRLGLEAPSAGPAARWRDDSGSCEQGRMTTSTREGGCLCGSVRYRVTGDPIAVSYCHCPSCRRASGAPATAWAMFSESAFTWTGTPAARYGSSPGVTRTFCGRCGTPLVYLADALPGLVDVTVGSLDDPAALRPEMHLWETTRLPWLEIADGLPRHAEFPPLPEGST